MKIGDTLGWRGVNKDHHGIITQSEKGDLVVMMDGGSSLPLEDLLGSTSFRVFRQDNPGAEKPGDISAGGNSIS